MGCALEGQVRNGLFAGGRWIRTSGSANECRYFRRGDRHSGVRTWPIATGNRWFESISLQRRVWYEPDIHALEGGATETFRSNGPNSPLFSAVNSASSRRQHDGSIQFICMDWRHRGAVDCWPLRLWRAEDRLVS